MQPRGHNVASECETSCSGIRAAARLVSAPQPCSRSAPFRARQACSGGRVAAGAADVHAGARRLLRVTAVRARTRMWCRPQVFLVLRAGGAGAAASTETPEAHDAAEDTLASSWNRSLALACKCQAHAASLTAPFGRCAVQQQGGQCNIVKGFFRGSTGVHLPGPGLGRSHRQQVAGSGTA